MTSDSASRVTRNRPLRLAAYGLIAGAGLAGVLHAQEPASTNPAASQEQAAPASTPSESTHDSGTTPAPASSGKPASAPASNGAPTAQPPEDAASKSASGAAGAPAADAGADQDTQDQNAPAPKGPSPIHFEPTEKVRADFDVSFPVDI